MKALAAALVASLVLSACASGRELDRREFFERRVLRANPGKVIATELALAREMREKGQWTAFAEYAAGDAVLFEPGPVDAGEWLARQVNPPRAIARQPYRVWSSCDGTLAVTRGAWRRPDGSAGYYTTVWKRQRDGDYKWAMNQGDELTEPLEAPAMIDATTADCTPEPNPVVMSGRDGHVRRDGFSRDRTLYWSVDVAPDGGRSLLVKLSQGGTMENVVRETVAPDG